MLLQLCGLSTGWWVVPAVGIPTWARRWLDPNAHTAALPQVAGMLEFCCSGRMHARPAGDTAASRTRCVYMHKKTKKNVALSACFVDPNASILSRSGVAAVLLPLVAALGMPPAFCAFLFRVVTQGGWKLFCRSAGSHHSQAVSLSLWHVWLGSREGQGPGGGSSWDGCRSPGLGTQVECWPVCIAWL